MDSPQPPQISAATAQLVEALKQVEKKDFDAASSPWADVEKGVIKLLGGAFQVERPEHQAIALGLAGFFGARLAKEHQAFWFPNRESLDGAVMGFPSTLLMLSPFGAVVEALRLAKLERLDDMLKEIRLRLAEAKFGGGGDQPLRLTALDYQRLFDPGFVQFVTLDPQKSAMVYDSAPTKLAREIRDALGRAGSKMPDEARKQLEAQIVGSLERMDPSRPIKDQVERSPRIVELLAYVFGTVAGTGAAPEEFWNDLVLPILHIGAPEKFPPLEAEELKAARAGVEPLYLMIELVPYQIPAVEDGLLETFAADEVQLPHAGFDKVSALRLIKLKNDRLKGWLATFEPATVATTVARFSGYLAEQSKKEQAQGEEAKQLLEAACTLLGDLKKATQAKGELHMRRLTEAEAASEGALALLRDALNGPRIILT